jgi:hypothetical protein
MVHSPIFDAGNTSLSIRALGGWKERLLPLPIMALQIEFAISLELLSNVTSIHPLQGCCHVITQSFEQTA